MSHYSIDFGTPIYCCAFIDPKLVVLGGGGGTTKSGITNKISVIRLEPAKKTSDVVEDYRLAKGEDAPMSMDFDRNAAQLICGINASSIDSKSGQNQHLRTFSLDKSHRLKPTTSQQTLTYTSEEDYQRLTCLSESAPRFLAVGGTNNQLDILTYPGCKPAFATIRSNDLDKQSQLLAVDFNQSGSEFLVGSSNAVQLYSTRRKPSKKKNQKRPAPATLLRQFDLPKPPSDQTCSFRTAKYGRGSNGQSVYTIINHIPLSRPGPRQKSRWGAPDRKAMLISWNAEDGSRRRTKVISTKPVTAFDVSSNGDLLAFASSDLSVGILDAKSLRSLLSILHAHEFPVTCIRFSPDDKRVVSCSADMTLRVIEMREGTAPWSATTLLLLLAFFIICFAILIQFLQPEFSLFKLQH